MTYDEVMKELEAAGSAQCRKIYGRHGVKGDQFGVSYAALGKLEKKIKKNQALAEELWKSGNHDARVLAAKIAEPEKCSQKLLEAWAKDLDNYILTDALSGVATRSAHGRKLFKKWNASKDEWKSSLAWNLVTSSEEKDGFTAAELEELIPEIEKRIHSAPNRTRYTMVLALIRIGATNAALSKKAIAASKRIGKVEVDHGETGCKTPEVEPYIKKMQDHAAKMAERKAAKTKAAPKKKTAKA